MKSGVGAFNKAASVAYEKLDDDKKQMLRRKAERQFSDVTKVDVRKKAASVFKKYRFRFAYNTLIR